jgi:hypothetical protein
MNKSQKLNLFGVLKIGLWSLFEFCLLLFVIYITALYFKISLIKNDFTNIRYKTLRH